MSALSPIQAAAMAAERRMHDELWCDSGSHEDPIVIDSKDGMFENHTVRELGEFSKFSDRVKEVEISMPVVSRANEKTENSLQHLDFVWLVTSNDSSWMINIIEL